MAEEYQVKKLAGKIRSIRKSAEELRELVGGIKAVDRNLDRLMSSVKMLEINVSDIADLADKKNGETLDK